MHRVSKTVPNVRFRSSFLMNSMITITVRIGVATISIKPKENRNKITFLFHLSSTKNTNVKKISSNLTQYKIVFLGYKNVIRTTPTHKIPDNNHLFLSLVAFTWQIPNAHKKTPAYPNK